MPRPAVFFDRDNTLIANNDYLGDPDGVSLLPGAAHAVARVRNLGFVTVVVSNQSGVARGMFGEDDVRAVNARMDAVLLEAHPDAVIDHHEFCPHHPKGTVTEYAREHPRRKPQPGMLLDAAESLDLDLDSSWLIGDAPRDIEAGRRAGCRTILVRESTITLHSPAASELLEHDPDYIASSLEDAVDFIEMQLGERSSTSVKTSETSAPFATQPVADEQVPIDEDETAVSTASTTAITSDESPRSEQPDWSSATPTTTASVAPVSSHLGIMKAAIESSAPPAGTDKQTLLVLERMLEELRRTNDPPQDFSVARMLGGIVQGFAIAIFFAALIYRNEPAFIILIGIAIFLQAMVSSLVLMGR